MQESGNLTEANATDLEHLRLLSVFHYVVGVLVILQGCFGLLHTAIGLGLLLTPDAAWNQDMPAPLPRMIGAFFFLVGSLFVLSGWTLGFVTIYSGHCLQQRKQRLFSLIVAAILCAFFPFGTILGVFTLIVLQRDSVRRMYPSG